MRNILKNVGLIVFESLWPLALGVLLYFGGASCSSLFDNYLLFVFFWVGIQIGVILLPFGLLTFEKIRVLSVFVGVIWAIGVYGYFLCTVSHFLEKSLLNISGKTLLKNLTHFKWDDPHVLMMSFMFLWSVSALGLSFYVLKYALTSLKGTKAILKKKNRNPENSSTHGSAIFSSLKEISALNNPDGIPIGMYTSKSLRESDPLKRKALLKSLKNGDILKVKADHSVVIAPSGAGKGVGIIVPTLLDYKGPVFVTDIKGENYQITYKARKEMGHEVICLDPFEITTASLEGWNILDVLKIDSPTVVEDSASIAALLSPQKKSEGGNSRYFSEQAARLIQCLILHVSCSSEISDDQRNLVTVFDLLMQSMHNLKNDTLLQIATDEDLLDGIVSSLASRILGTEERELSGTLNTASQELSFLQSPLMRKFFTKSTFNTTQVLDAKTDIYVCLPPEHRESYGRFMRLVTGSIFLEMQKSREKKGASFQNHKLLMVLDEMPSLGHISAIEDMIVYGRGYGVSVMAVSQTIELIKSTYPESWKTFLSNHLTLFFGCSDNETCKIVSDMLGKRTVLGFSHSKGQGNQKKSLEWMGSNSLQEGNSYGEVGRALLTADEVKTLGDDIVIGFLRGKRAIMIKRLSYMNHNEYKGRFLENSFYEC